jgi:hypothetical protein
MCKRSNASPRLALELDRAVMTTQKRQTSIYLPDPMRDAIQAIADREQRSFTFVVEMLLKEALEARETIGKKD